MITLAIPNGGRLASDSELLLKMAGISTKRPHRSLQCVIPNMDLKIVFVHPKDCGKLIEDEWVDIAITAQDILAEYPSNVTELAPLGFSTCRIVVAVKEISSVKNIEDLRSTTIATNYPHLTKRWFIQRDICVNIFSLHGAVEFAPWLGLCSGVVDSYQTGESAKANHLRVIDTVLFSQAVLISKSSEIVNSQKAYFVELLTKTAQSIFITDNSEVLNQV